MEKEKRARKVSFGHEVASESLEDFRRLSVDYTGDKATIFGNGLEHLVDHSDRFSWSDLCELYRRLDKMLQVEGLSLEDLGKLPDGLPLGGAVGKAFSVVASPRLLYTVGNRFGLERTFSHLEVGEKLLPDGRILIEITIPAPYETSPECFRFTAGVLEGLPQMLGLSLATVEWSYSGRTAEYIVTPPASATLWSRGRRLLRAFGASQSAVEELITQQKELNRKHKELKSAYDQVSQALEVRQRFLRVVSHEFRTPLNGIAGACSMLRVEEDRATRDTLLDALGDSSNRLSNLVEEMLDFVAMNDGKLKATPSEVDFRTEVRSFVGPFVEEAKRKRLTLDVDIARDFPNVVALDTQRLLRAVGHLLDNAIKFTPTGRVSISMGFEPGEGAVGTVQLIVTDQGPGIPERDQDAIFSLFTQGDDSSTRDAGGTGLGLALVRRSIDLLGGEVSLQSKLGQGSQFVVRVPTKVIATAETPAAVAQETSGRILVVDDDRINRMLLKRMVQTEGLDVDLAEDGAEALAMVQQNDYDLVFMDCEMPRMDGWEATAKIRAAGRQPADRRCDCLRDRG